MPRDSRRLVKKTLRLFEGQQERLEALLPQHLDFNKATRLMMDKFIRRLEESSAQIRNQIAREVEENES